MYFEASTLSSLFIDSMIYTPFLANFVKLCYTVPKRGGDEMPTTGEKPGKGTYKCTKCGQIVVLDDNTDTLPPCPTCNGTNFIKIG